jgi:hypothetical protein
LSKSGYFDWRQKIKILSEVTTFIKDKRLFKIPALISIKKDMTDFIAAPQNNNILIGGNDTLSFINTVSGEIQNISDLTMPAQNIRWSSNGAKFIAQINGVWQVYDVKSPASPIILTGASDAEWDTDGNSAVYLQKNDGFYKMDVLFKTQEKKFAPQLGIAGFLTADGALYTVKQSALKQTDGANIITIPLERKNYKIAKIENKKIYLLNNEDQKLQIFQLPLHAASTPILIANAKNFDVLGDNLLFYNDFEIWTYDFSSGAKELMNRFGENIKKTVWANGADYIIIALDGQIKIMENGLRDTRQTLDILQLKSIADFVLTKKYVLYLWSSAGGGEIFNTDL